jgi:hypothetical protein
MCERATSHQNNVEVMAKFRAAKRPWLTASAQRQQLPRDAGQRAYSARGTQS